MGNELSTVILGKLLVLKKFTEKTSPEINVGISSLVFQTDDGKAS